MSSPLLLACYPLGMVLIRSRSEVMAGRRLYSYFVVCTWLNNPCLHGTSLSSRAYVFSFRSASCFRSNTDLEICFQPAAMLAIHHPSIALTHTSGIPNYTEMQRVESVLNRTGPSSANSWR